MNKHWYYIIPGICTAILVTIFVLGNTAKPLVPIAATPVIKFTHNDAHPIYNPVLDLYLSPQPEDSPYQTTLVSVGGTPYRLEVANTEPLRVLGLSNRQSLCPQCGMLFVFDQIGRHGIWMKDMHLSLDIIWLDAGRQIVHIKRNVSPDTYPTVFQPPVDATYVIEILPQQ